VVSIMDVRQNYHCSNNTFALLCLEEIEIEAQMLRVGKVVIVIRVCFLLSLFSYLLGVQDFLLVLRFTFPFIWNEV